MAGLFNSTGPDFEGDILCSFLGCFFHFGFHHLNRFTALVLKKTDEIS